MLKTNPGPGITIAMPFFNSAGTMELSIRSILNQSYGNFELLLCDDGSYDQSRAIARSFDDPRIFRWSDRRQRGLGARLNECIDRARGHYLARMDAEDIAYPDRLAAQMAFLAENREVDLCGGSAMVFGKHGRPLWRFSPPTDHAEIVRSPSLGFPLLHPAWMGHIEWFRRWRYDESAGLAQDRELLLRSHRDSRFANLRQIVLGYREPRITLREVFNLLHLRHVCKQPGQGLYPWQKTEDLNISAARFAANCVGAPIDGARMEQQAVQAKSAVEPAEWHNLWTLLAVWYGRPCSETFVSSSLLQQARSSRWIARSP